MGGLFFSVVKSINSVIVIVKSSQQMKEISIVNDMQSRYKCFNKTWMNKNVNWTGVPSEIIFNLSEFPK